MARLRISFSCDRLYVLARYCDELPSVRSRPALSIYRAIHISPNTVQWLPVGGLRLAATRRTCIDVHGVHVFFPICFKKSLIGVRILANGLARSISLVNLRMAVWL